MGTNYQLTIAPPSLALEVHPSGRFLRDSLSKEPFLLVGDTAWTIFNELDSTELETYLPDCRSRGITALITQLTNPVRYVTGSHAPGAKGAGDALPFLLNASGTTWDGDPGFRDNILGLGGTPHHDAAFSSPNNTYWDWVDYVIERCRFYGLQQIADINYLGFNNGAADGWWQTLTNSVNTQAVCFAFGQYLGARCKLHPNLILNLGTDMFPAVGSEGAARQAQILAGMRNAGCTQLASFHGHRSSNAYDFSDFASLVNVNSVYPGAGGSNYAPNHGRSRLAYSRTPPSPCACVETKYKGEFGFTRVQVREQAWWGYLSTIGGHFYGNNPIWVFGSGWPTELSDPTRLDQQRLGAFLRENGRKWWTLVPNGLGTPSIGPLVTAGGGSAQTIGSPGTDDTNDGTDYVAAACNYVGTFLVAYVPDAHTGSVTIDMTKLRASSTARWYDPTNGTYTAIGSIANTGTHAFTIPGTNSEGKSDWVLVLEAP